MSRACRRQYARIKPKAVDLGEPELRLRMAAQKWLKCLPGNSFGAPNCHMGMKGPEIRFETDAQDRILNAPMKCKKMRMALTDAHPDNRWPVARIKDTDAAEGQKKRWNPHFAQSLTQTVLCGRFHCAEKTQRQMQLFFRKPSQTGKMRVEIKQRRLESRRKFEADEKPFRRRHSGEESGFRSQNSEVRIQEPGVRGQEESKEAILIFASVFRT
jgi:hypothetical protein